MAVVNHETKEVTFKIVYCGTPVGGKTTNLQYIHSRIEADQRGDLVSLATSTDRTLFFDFLPINTVVINGYSTKFMLYTIPGQVCYNATRQLVLKGVDGVVFVSDSAPERMEENLQSLQTLRRNLTNNGITVEALPMVFQYNKRDLPEAVPVTYLEYLLNNSAPRRVSFEAAANTGYNVFATLNAVAEQILQKFHLATQPAPTPAAPPQVNEGHRENSPSTTTGARHSDPAALSS
jgi:signal recognition particle receptor subunit beta